MSPEGYSCHDDREVYTAHWGETGVCGLSPPRGVPLVPITAVSNAEVKWKEGQVS